MDKPEDIIKVIITGASNKPVPLLAVADLFKELHHAVDKSYLSLSGKEKLSKSDREEYKIIAVDIKSGSVVADLLIITPLLIQSAFEFYSTGLTVTNIWELTKNSFKFSKIIAELKHSGKKPNVIQHHNPDALNIINYGNNVNIEIGNRVYNNALRSEQSIKNLAKIVDEKNVSNFSALDKR